MIARFLIFWLLLIVLPDAYIYKMYRRARRSSGLRLIILNSILSIVMVVYTVWLASLTDFIPSEKVWLDLYLLLFAVFIVPKTMFVLCSLFSFIPCFSRRWCHRIGAAASLLMAGMAVYGAFVGFRRMEIRHIEIASSDIPKAFDGYRIVQFSDAHVGTYYGIYKEMLRSAVDSINTQRADAIVFTGDLQNIVPQEIHDHADELSRLKAKDGVFAVLGNHDYSTYVNVSKRNKAEYERETQTAVRSLGWSLLMNENRKVRRGNDSIVIAGEENDSKPPMPHRGNIKKTLQNVDNNAFVVLLQHDPSAWQRDILPHSEAQLTLSGHTHGGQMSLGSIRPTMLKYDEDYGLYEQSGRFLNVSCGLGGVVPFRIGMSGEIVVITLVKREPQKGEVRGKE